MRLVSSTLIALLLLSGCTGGGASSDAAAPPATTTTPSATPAADAPDCRTVWKRGEELPADFTTCVLGARVPDFEKTECLDGSMLVVIDDAVWGRTGQGEIVRAKQKPAQDTDAYNTDLALCTGR